ncbi:T9SS-dependent M36 family metallopeptidase [Flavobacterium sp. NRK F10]|uniref:Peptidase M36 n=1 Tax=Flavobacterium sediminis TaxID=2201181 RepID=A0A2U8QU47_9FLAO|nr:MULTISPECIES: T9SS-dependent M36 family metallopeptidase [Flavobacterium]AWM13396.1 peptidase M36 [Flavobacterium sediminis]MCO6174510.1 T9SS-dependent M36 family metallopeptidase [Flavobacterium sp. NRK F10]
MKKTLQFFVLFSVGLVTFAQDYNSKVQEYLNTNRQKLGLSQSDVNDWFVESTANSEATGITNYYVKQNYQGVEVFNSVSNFWIKNDAVINADVKFVQNLSSKINTATPVVDVLEAFNYAHQNLGENAVSHQVLDYNGGRIVLSNGNLDDSATAKIVYASVNDYLHLAWDLTYYSQDYKHLWSVRIDAVNGELLEKHDWVISCDFKGCADPEHHHDSQNFFSYKKMFNVPTTTLLSESSTYNVLPFEIESPNHGSRQLLSSPYDLVASPYGWHDINQIDGAEYTYTRGNNVFAQEDQNGNNGNGNYPDGGASLVFDFPYGGIGVAATTYTDAATTNLFYMNNIMHDVWYHYGFNEVNGNFQKNNYGNGGTTTFFGDFVYADAQDGSGTNNANFSTPVDGSSPRMQMYLWDVGPVPYYLTINSPSSIAGDYYAADNAFDPGHIDLPALPGLTTDLVLYQDATPDNTDACETAVNAAQLAGKIVVIRRGTCNFTVKVLNAQNAGAAAVIIVNNDTANPNQYVNMSGADAGITIPAVFVTYNIGEALIAEMASGTVNATLKNDDVTFINSDGDFDNGVIAHEYTHGISTRLTGGASNSSCLQSSEQMGEGWSDWAALMMQVQAGDQPTDVKGIATFLYSEPTNGTGIRQYPYSTDMSIDPLTFGDTNGMWYTYNGSDYIDVHSVGTVWATMLWDLTWAYIDKYGFDPDKYNGTGGNNKVMQLVLDAMKLQPCNPSFVSGRDAIIAADQATTGGEDYCMIWEVFARRGLGVNASSGTNSGIAGINDQTEDFTEPAPGPNCVLSANYFENTDMFKVYPNPANNNLNISILNYSGKLNIQLFDLNGRVVVEQKVDSFNLESTINIQSLQAGVYMLKVQGDNLSYTQKIIKQ